MEQPQLYMDLLAAYVRGCGVAQGDDEAALYQAGKAAGLKLYRFKRGHEELPRVRRVLGFFRGIGFESLLDVGSGRGVFLFPFLEAFPWVRVTSMDILPHRVAFLQAIASGGIDRLTAQEGDLCRQPFPEKSFDVVTVLEVLEHIPQVQQAVNAAVKMARKFVVVTVPSQPDNNPEHIHLLTKARLTQLFNAAGCHRLRFDGVNGHLILIATVEQEN